MMRLQLRDVSLAYSAAKLLDQVNLQIEDGERVCLVGRNGSGKTSLMRVLCGDEMPNEGEVISANGTVYTRLNQEIPQDLAGTVMEVIHSGIRPEWHEEEWEIENRLSNLASGMNLPIEEDFKSLSGGMKRRVLLARALAGRPHVLLLDEPTNHLDLESILWLEQFLLQQKMTLFFVTHDRAFLRKLATRIVELDRGRLSSWDCDYDTYLERKAAALEAEEKQVAAFDKKLAQEEAWLRQGIKARRTRNEGRVKALMRLRAERREFREREGTARIEIQDGKTSGQKVIEANDVSFGYGEKRIVDHLTTTIWRGDKIGIIGPNGCGKTTLLKLLLGELESQGGIVKLGTKLDVVYLDQLRGQIDDSKTVAENVAGDADHVTFGGQSRHIHSYLQDFLFRTEQVRMQARMLSGGERNRLLLARLFLQPANVLVLDEPTNDLDVETLELLEKLFVDYTGTLLLVSHDRVFLDNVVTSTLVFEGDGRISDYVGGYEDWLSQRKVLKTNIPASQLSNLEVGAGDEKSKGKKERPRKFLNREKRELEELPALIEDLESQQSELAKKLWDPEIYQKEPESIPALKEQVSQIESQIAKSYARWEELEELRKSLESGD